MEDKKDFGIIFLRDLEKYNWSLVDQNSNHFAKQLNKEMTKDHPLFNKDLTAIAKDNASDDVLFADESRCYIIHLTYTMVNKNEFIKYEIFENTQELEQYFLKNYIVV